MKIHSLNIASYVLTTLGLLSLFQGHIDLSKQIANIVFAYQAFWYTLVDILLGWTQITIPSFFKDLLIIWSGLALSFRSVLQQLAKLVSDDHPVYAETVSIEPISRPRVMLYRRMLRFSSNRTVSIIATLLDYIIAPLWYLFLICYLPFSGRAREEGVIAAKSLGNIVLLFVLVIGLNFLFRLLGF